ncbi:MAG: carbon-nitrogen hydrolase family protein [Verrucomicrobiales bacterium]|nr:carbon-nitrogen hydrolase family protein [Verrucomicrobiales bacterium]
MDESDRAKPEGMNFEPLANAAAQKGIVVCAGLIERNGDRLFNSAVLLDRSGRKIAHHRKINELEIAHEIYTSGESAGPPVETEIGKIGLHICADAFVEEQWISREIASAGADVILSPCAWAVPPEFDPVVETYGQIWRENYEPVAREFGVAIAGCSCVGPIRSGPWAGHSCIGNSMVFDSRGREILTGPHGANADELLFVEIE